MRDTASELQGEGISRLFEQIGTEPLTAAEVATKAECSQQTAREKLTALVDRGYLQTKEVGSGERVWWSPGREREREDEREGEHESEREREREHDEQETQQSADVVATQQLQEISTQLIRENDAAALYQKVLDAAVDIMDADYGSMQMLDSDRGELKLLAHRGFSSEAASFWEWVSPEAGSTCGMALDTGERIIASDVETCEFMSDTEDREVYLQAGIRAVQTTPLVARDGDLLGMISTHWETPHDPPERKLHLLDVLARQAADLIERTRSEVELKKREEHLSALVETTPECIKTVDADGTLRQMNRTGLDMVEAESASDVIGESVYDLIAPDDRAQFREFNERICQGESGTIEFEIIGLNGSRRHMKTHAAPLRSPDGTRSQLALTRDITEQVERERELERARDMLAETERIANVGGWEINVATREVFWTDHIFELLEVDADEEPSLEEILTMFHEADQQRIRNAVEGLLDSGDPFDIEARVRTDSGETRWLRLRSASEIGDDTATSIRGAAQDITDRKQREQRLEELIDDLEESNSRLEQFAYAASHDLQEPLRMISSYLQLIEQRYAADLDGDGEEFLEFAIDGSERMRNMIQGLLKYSRVETRGEPLEPVDLDAVFADVCEDLQLRITESNARVSADSLPRINGDEEQLRQVFQNLLDNAIEYSGDEPPQIHISAEQEESQSRPDSRSQSHNPPERGEHHTSADDPERHRADQNRTRNCDTAASDEAKWTVSVSDNGVGIDSDDTDRVFEVFQSLHPPDEHAGTGIGLALCERIVERHGGEIWVDSEPNEGTTFSFTLPAAPDHPI
ncbi:ATP-binding protein [Natrialba sp. SSL1]|uniref:ATP-binding protein n=1 Tax=Natrialba sp. SSL1 TaxID=1869245 RepID=UPI0008F84B7C|nr:ATP-binding protein [Natrialba sp. SSL1]OIB56341.1 hypothetical protein BBD46_18480 [Natrialba sp. SSL1]